jgi:ADP-ribosylglycohydrolase
MNLSIDERLAGAIWGHLVGDALGVPYEFRGPGSITDVRWGATGTHGQPPGTWSDDGGLMLALLDSLLKVGFDLEDQAQRALAWYHTDAYKPGALFDIGGTTRQALERLKAGVPAIDAGGSDERDNGNGSLMRILPVAIFDPSLTRQDVIDYAMGAGCITHAHPRSQLVCSIYCSAARRFVDGQDDLNRILLEAIRDVEAFAPDDLLAELPGFRAYADRNGSGYVVDSFWSAWATFASSGSYQEAVESAVLLGNDTDTTACLAGGLAGLRWGVGAIPSPWLAGMRGRELVEPLISALVSRWHSA